MKKPVLNILFSFFRTVISFSRNEFFAESDTFCASSAASLSFKKVISDFLTDETFFFTAPVNIITKIIRHAVSAAVFLNISSVSYYQNQPEGVGVAVTYGVIVTVGVIEGEGV